VGNRSFSDDSPSPYVGTIDLEHSLKPIETKRIRKRASSPVPSVDALMKDVTAPENTHIGLAIDRKKRERQRKRSVSPKGPLGGCYRVPQQGQLQIVIKNPNKTAVKLYLVPYSLDGMEAGMKTFVRQRSFSAGPIMEKPLTDNPQAVLPDPLQYKSILRYLIHLKFCCPSKGRYYLYDNIRVVFANRVPDGKESLRNEVQVPEPRYSCYRPGRESWIGSAGAKLAAEKASRRRSSGFGLRPAGLEAMDGLSFTGIASTLPADSSEPSSFSTIPFHPLPRLKLQTQTGGSPDVKEARLNTDASVGVNTTWPTPWKAVRTVRAIQPALPEPRERTVSPTPGFLPSISTRASPVRMLEFGRAATGVGGSPSISRTVSPTPSDCSEGLLARELRSIGHPEIDG
jgi:Chromosome segregation during meiosis